jgi:hypothetical protein
VTASVNCTSDTVFSSSGASTSSVLKYKHVIYRAAIRLPVKFANAVDCDVLVVLIWMGLKEKFDIPSDTKEDTTDTTK